MLERFFAPDTRVPGHLWARWLFLRCLGLIFLSAFYSLAYQIHGLIGPDGILPARGYLEDVTRVFLGLGRFWYAPTFFWIGASDAALSASVVAGVVASLLLVFNVIPRLAILVAAVAFLSFVAAAQDFSSYQSDGMLLEAAFLSLFFAPGGLRPGLGAAEPPSRATLFMLRWEWFRIYFESGVVKLASGDPSWRDLTAMDHYYENGPLPTWMGWYVQHWPHSFHAATVVATFVIELGVVGMVFLKRRHRLACFFVVTPLQLGIIATANYAFLNYIVLVLGVLLLDDGYLVKMGLPSLPSPSPPVTPAPRRRLYVHAVALGAAFYCTLAIFLFVGAPAPLRFLLWPVQALEPLRIANRYGLFAVMTTQRYEIEFEGSRDGTHWETYPFRYKPQNPRAAPGVYAPYQPRFEWNLWFASLGNWQQYPWVLETEARLLEGSPQVLSLFAFDPFRGSPPRYVRAPFWRYWFSTREEKKTLGLWWDREELGLYCPALERRDDGTIAPMKITAGEP